MFGRSQPQCNYINMTFYKSVEAYFLNGPIKYPNHVNVYINTLCFQLSRSWTCLPCESHHPHWSSLTVCWYIFLFSWDTSSSIVLLSSFLDKHPHHLWWYIFFFSWDTSSSIVLLSSFLEKHPRQLYILFL